MFGCAAYRMNVLHVTVTPQVVYRAVYVDWKLRKIDEKHAGRSTLLYELDLKAANVEQTHTQSEYSHPRAHACRALIIVSCNVTMST